MRRFVFALVIMFAAQSKAANIKYDVNNLTPLGPDIGVLIENDGNIAVRYMLSFVPKNCDALGLNALRIKHSISSIDWRGEILPNDFMVAYYSLGSYNIKIPCSVKIGIATSSGVEEKYKEVTLSLDTFDIPGTDLEVGANNISSIEISHSFKRISKKAYELTLLLKNPSSSPRLVELERLELDCARGDLYIAQTDNYNDGIKNGRFVLKGNGWRAYKIVYRSNTEKFKCKGYALLDDWSKGAEKHIFEIENLNINKNNKGHPVRREKSVTDQQVKSLYTESVSHALWLRVMGGHRKRSR